MRRLGPYTWYSLKTVILSVSLYPYVLQVLHRKMNNGFACANQSHILCHSSLEIERSYSPQVEPKILSRSPHSCMLARGIMVITSDDYMNFSIGSGGFSGVSFHWSLLWEDDGAHAFGTQPPTTVAALRPWKNSQDVTHKIRLKHCIWSSLKGNTRNMTQIYSKT